MAAAVSFNGAASASVADTKSAHLHISQYRLQDAPSTIYYVPNFYGSAEQQQQLVTRIQDAPKPKWQSLSNRRLQMWGGIVGKRALLQCNDIPQWLQDVMDSVHTFAQPLLGEHRPNHVLINEYEPGQGIMPHTDGPAYHPVVCTVSLGCHTLLDLYNPVMHNQPDDDRPDSPSAAKKGRQTDDASLASRYLGSLLLEVGSLVVITEHAYTTLLHGIAERTQDSLTDRVIFNWNECSLTNGDHVPDVLTRTDTRYSLTIRNVPKVSTAALSTILGHHA